jgi:hypothetical protein
MVKISFGLNHAKQFLDFDFAPIKIPRREESEKVAQASGLWSNYFSQAGSLCHSEAMTRTEKLQGELIALPKCPVEIV